MNYIQQYLIQAVPLVSQHCHTIANVDLVNDRILESDMIRYYDGSDERVSRYGCDNTMDIDAPRILLSNYTDNTTEFLFTACKYGAFNTIQYLVKHNLVDLNKCNRRGNNIFECIRNNMFDLVKYLIQHGASVHNKTCNGTTPLLVACTHIESLEAVQYIVEQGADIYARDNDGNTALIHACSSHRSFDVIKYIVNLIPLDNRAAYINIANSKGNTALLKACQAMGIADKRPWSEIIQLLIDNGANINAVNKNNETALMLACRFKSFDVVKCIIDNLTRDELKIAINARDDFNYTPLLEACISNTPDTIKYLVKHGANVNARTDKCTVLIKACLYQPFYIVEYLIQHGADILGTGEYKYTPLMSSCEKQGFDCIKYLIDKHSDINAVSEYFNHTALLIACSHSKSFDIIKYIIDSGADINAVDRWTYTPLMYACINLWSFDVVKYLIETQIKRGGDVDALVNAKTHNGHTPLHYACSDHKINKTDINIVLNIVQCLLDNGADVFALGSRNFTPLMCACTNFKSLELVQCIINHVIKTYGTERATELINMQDTLGNTILIYMTGYNIKAFDAIKYIIKLGADINIKNNDGGTALIYAYLYHDIELIQYLIDNCNIDLTIYSDKRNPIVAACMNNQSLKTIQYITDRYITAQSECIKSLEPAIIALLEHTNSLDTLKYMISVNRWPIDYDKCFYTLCKFNIRIEFFKYFVQELGVNVNIRYFNGTTPLMQLCNYHPVLLLHYSKNTCNNCITWNNIFECVKYLVECGANVNIINDDGSTALSTLDRTFSYCLDKELLNQYKTIKEYLLSLMQQ